MIGERNSGKGLLQTIDQNAFGPYVNTIDSSQLMLNASATDVKAQSWVIDCEFSRQTYTNEVKINAGNSRVKLDGGLIKKFQSGGDVIKARRNYENEREVRTASRLFMNLNEMPQISAVDVLEQAIVFEFPFKFVTPGQGGSIPWLPFYRESDPSMKVYCGRADVIDAFTWLVLDAHRSSPVQMSSDVQRETYRLRVDEGDELVLVNQDMNMEPPPLQNQLPFYVTQEQFVACELRIMQRMQQHLNDINDARTELITANMHMQQQINHVRDAVRALEHRVQSLHDHVHAISDQSAGQVVILVAEQNIISMVGEPDAYALRAASPTIEAQYVPTKIRKMFVVLDQIAV
eukprot:gene1520-biopygen14370